MLDLVVVMEQVEKQEKQQYMRKGDLKWMYTILPSAIATGPVSTLVSLYILQLGGGVIEVAYAITLGSVIAIIGSMFWGKITDLMGKRKIFMVLSFLGVALTLLELYFSSNISEVIVSYAIYNFLNVSNNAATSLLVMETSAKPKLASSFSLLQSISSLGSTVGYVVSYFFTGFTSLGVLSLVLFAFSLLSAVLAFEWIYEPKVLLQSGALVKEMFTVLTGWLVLPFLFIIRLPTINIFRKILDSLNFRTIRSKVGYFGLFTFSAILFYFATSLFNTVYPVGLKQVGLSESQIFLIFAIGNFAQCIVFYYYNKIVKDRGNSLVAKGGLLLRGSAYVSIGIIFLLFTGMKFFFSNLIIYTISVGLAYSLYYVSSNIILFKIINLRQRGVALGAFSSLTGVGTVGGALISGYLVSGSGYGFTFIFAGLFIILSLFVFLKLKE